MTRVASAAIVAISVLSCAGGVTSNYPLGGSTEDSARVVVGRRNIFVGGAVPHTVLLDGTAIASIKPGQYIDFFVSPGDHAVAIGNSRESIAFEQGEAYYFLSSITPSGAARMERVLESTGSKIPSEYQRLQP